MKFEIGFWQADGSSGLAGFGTKSTHNSSKAWQQARSDVWLVCMADGVMSDAGMIGSDCEARGESSPCEVSREQICIQ